MHHELCNGLDLPGCTSCAHHVDRYPQAVRIAQKTRLRPMATPPRCADWIELPQRAIDSSHDKL